MKILTIVLFSLAIIQIAYQNASDTAAQRFEGAANARIAAIEAAVGN